MNVTVFNARSNLARNLVADQILEKNECLTSFSWKCNVNALIASPDSVQLDVLAVGYRDGTIILVSMPATECFFLHGFQQGNCRALSKPSNKRYPLVRPPRQV